jgi:hypothetical protein
MDHMLPVVIIIVIGLKIKLVWRWATLFFSLHWVLPQSLLDRFLPEYGERFTGSAPQ